ncbi:MAG: hypothetical protein MJE68_27630 [Proteobacteria bacterium]|nr:hypothetical protein [Pseudomonadota bacterium]
MCDGEWLSASFSPPPSLSLSISLSLSLSLLPLSLSAVFQALCLEQLTARELLTRIAEKLSLSLDNVSTLVRLTSTGILVLVDDVVS